MASPGNSLCSRLLRRWAPALLLLAIARTTDGQRWYKGNTHAHTLNSDGDSSPDDVARWYREHGYHFLVLSDHNHLTSVDGLNALLGADEKFILIPGEEVTDRFGDRPIHVNGLQLSTFVPPQGGNSVVEVIQNNIDAIRAARGLPSLNHPNFGWAVTAADMKKLRNDRLFEVYNGHPLVNNEGGGGAQSLEEMWDEVLSSGKLLYGIAVDDAHHFKRPGDRSASTPGHGWIQVRASRLTAIDIITALDRGDFYASTGVELSSLDVSPRRISIVVKPAGTSRYTTRFIGRNGRVLATVHGPDASYDIRGDEGYVRAVVHESNGAKAWIQPVMPGPGG
ncbi:MAG: CehA/McbA family metallohydrolase [Gemmatimonadota bacterium]